MAHMLNPFTPRVSYGDIKVILTFVSMDEILWCDHSNETLSAVLSRGTIYIYLISILQNEIWDSSWIRCKALLGVKGSKGDVDPSHRQWLPAVHSTFEFLRCLCQVMQA